MENPGNDRAEETFAQVLAALKDEYRISENKIADRIGVHVSTVNNWVHGKANPRAATVRALAAEFPKFTEARLFAAMGKRAPAPLSPDRKAVALEILDRLTEEQQDMFILQARAVADSNQ